MRILISTWGWRSHFYCLVPLGWALRSAGHEVLVASHPSMAQTIAGAGLAAVPLGEDVDFAEVFTGRIGKVGRLDQNGDGGALEPAITPDGGVVRLAEAMLDDLVAFGRSYRPDLLVWEPFNLAAPVAAAALDVPGVLVLWGPDSSVTLRLDRETVLGPLAHRFGLDAGDISLTGTLTLDPVPPPMQVPLAGPSQPIRYVPYNGTAVMPQWLHKAGLHKAGPHKTGLHKAGPHKAGPHEPGLREPAKRPRVCLTAGTVAGPGLSERTELPQVIRAVAELDVEVVVLVAQAHRAMLGVRGGAGDAGPLPGNVRVPDAPLALHLVLPTCAAMIQHGGAGTMMTALDCGVPQLILPRVSDEHFNGERLAVTGAGTWLDDPDPATVRDKVGELVGVGHWRESAMLFRERMHRMPAPAAVVDSLVALATGART